jgi:hypothetical protein
MWYIVAFALGVWFGVFVMSLVVAARDNND